VGSGSENWLFWSILILRVVLSGNVSAIAAIRKLYVAPYCVTDRMPVVDAVAKKRRGAIATLSAMSAEFLIPTHAN
jgi:hypothetical protein